MLSEYEPSICSFVVCVYLPALQHMLPSAHKSLQTGTAQLHLFQWMHALERTTDNMRQMCDRLYCMTVIVSNNSLYIISNVWALVFASGKTDDTDTGAQQFSDSAGRGLASALQQNNYINYISCCYLLQEILLSMLFFLL